MRRSSLRCQFCNPAVVGLSPSGGKKLAVSRPFLGRVKRGKFPWPCISPPQGEKLELGELVLWMIAP